MIKGLFVRDWVVTTVDGGMFVTEDGIYTSHLAEAKRFTVWGGGRYVKRYYQRGLSLRLRLITKAMKNGYLS